jgi:FKBP-type peptidyl-prolyl cis-trans isomerase 2
LTNRVAHLSFLGVRSQETAVGAKVMIGDVGFPSTIIEVTDTEVVFDANHPLAGETLTFEVELMELKRVAIKHKDKFQVRACISCTGTQSQPQRGERLVATTRGADDPMMLEESCDACAPCHPATHSIVQL